MADLSDDISSLLHTLLQNSSQPSTSSGPAPPGNQPGSGVYSAQPGLFDSGFGFGGGYYSSGGGGGGLGLDEINEVNCESEGQEDVHLNQAPRRGSSKRGRAADVHNLSEKRRRQRINERMKALQKLIPNSNKTDKASMLDEAIEYLKQLQLQVQMLTLRNGTSLHPLSPPGAPQSMNPLTIGQLIDEASNSRGIGIGSFTPGQDTSMQAMFDLGNNNPGQSLAHQPSMIYRPLGASNPSKVLCKEPGMPQLQLDMGRCGQSSSSGVSS